MSETYFGQLRVGSFPQRDAFMRFMRACQDNGIRGRQEELFCEIWPDHEQALSDLVDEYGGRFLGDFCSVGERDKDVEITFESRSLDDVEALGAFVEMLSGTGVPIEYPPGPVR